ncbi:hypothetical protein BKA61DRAFT_6716 [Leptodontidium sp. MPI-SDFR-AT-0119]|nr:hypothetical protein BKA61DRAFT_6716 [Leptodontidium sp. MPI-SDFR-AT-0119]
MKLHIVLTFTSLILCIVAFEPLNPINGLPAAPPRRPKPKSTPLSIAGGTFHEGSKQTNKPGTTSTKTIKVSLRPTAQSSKTRTRQKPTGPDTPWTRRPHATSKKMGRPRPTGPDTPWTKRDTMKKNMTTSMRTETSPEPQETGEVGGGGSEKSVHHVVAGLESRPIPRPRA